MDSAQLFWQLTHRYPLCGTSTAMSWWYSSVDQILCEHDCFQSIWLRIIWRVGTCQEAALESKVSCANIQRERNERILLMHAYGESVEYRTAVGPSIWLCVSWSGSFFHRPFQHQDAVSILHPKLLCCEEEWRRNSQIVDRQCTACGWAYTSSLSSSCLNASQYCLAVPWIVRHKSFFFLANWSNWVSFSSRWAMAPYWQIDGLHCITKIEWMIVGG